MKSFRTATAAFAAAAVVALPIASTLVSPTVAAAASTVSAQDKAWLVAAHQSNLSEIAAGKVAQQKATTSAVRQHGQLFISDHTRLDGPLKTLARQLGVALPSQPNALQRASLAKVSARSGRTFDKAWVSAQIVEHRQTAAAGKQELSNGRNPLVIAADKTAAPVVAAHLQMLLSTAKGRTIATGLSAPTENAALPWALVVCGAGLGVVGFVGLRRRPSVASR